MANLAEILPLRRRDPRDTDVDELLVPDTPITGRSRLDRPTVPHARHPATLSAQHAYEAARRAFLILAVAVVLLAGVVLLVSLPP
jgi:hypothetical protein